MRLFTRSRPDLHETFDKVWREVLAKTDVRLDEVALDAVRSDVRAHVQTWENSEESLMLLRTELMDSVDRVLVHRAFLSLDADMAETVREQMPDLPGEPADVERLVAANELRIAVIRAWGGRRYGDHAEGDWFDTYLKAAEMRQSGAIRDLERLAGDMPTATRNNIDAAIRGINSSLRLRLAQSPPGVKIGQRSR